MSDATLRIKNLSIALEALSNIADLEGDLDTIQQGVKELLKAEIQTFKEEKEKETQWPQRRPANTVVYVKDLFADYNPFNPSSI